MMILYCVMSCNTSLIVVTTVDMYIVFTTFFFNDTATTEFYTLSLHDALPIFGFYVAKYVNKKSDMDLAAKGLGAKEWNNSLKTKLSLLPKKLFRIRMSRNFGMKMLTMTNLSTECLIQLTKLGY